MHRFALLSLMLPFSLATALAQAQAAEPPPAPAAPEAAENPQPQAPETGAEGQISSPAPESTPEDEAALRERDLNTRINLLDAKLRALTEKMEAGDLERLVQDANTEAQAVETEERPEEREFIEGGLALQKLNPELTVSGDVIGTAVIDGNRFYAAEADRSGVFIRGLGLHLQQELDPYSTFKSALHFSPSHGVGLEELYISWFGLIPSTSLTLGRFRQNFGVLNRWHEHALDQSSFPLALRLVLGDEGLVGDGLMFKWLMPSLWAHANELTVELVDGSDEVLFSGEHFSVPSALMRLKNYYDLSSSTYLELGTTGMAGFNNRRGVLQNDTLIDEPWRRTLVGGADLTVFWSPPDQAKYRSLTWRSEFYFATRELPAERARSWSQSAGLYSYLQYQLSERWFAGVRGDAIRPTERDSGKVTWDVVPYLTVWQSEFVYFRLEAQHAEQLPYANPSGTLSRRSDNRALLQVDFAAGPHKHEKY